EKGTLQINIHYQIPILFPHPQQESISCYTSIIHEYLNFFKFFGRTLENTLDIRRVCDIGLNGNTLDATCCQLRSSLISNVDINIYDDYIYPTIRKRLCYSLSYTTPSAGYDRSLPIHVLTPPEQNSLQF